MTTKMFAVIQVFLKMFLGFGGKNDKSFKKN